MNARPYLVILWFAIIMAVVARPMPGLAVSPQSLDAWEAYTSVSDMHRLLVVDHELWAISSGGILRYDTQTRQYQRYTRLDGLAGNLVSSAASDPSGDLWFGTAHRGLSRFNAATQRFQPVFREFEHLRIKALLVHGNQLYVGTGRGISAFMTDREEVRENYRQLGSLPRDTAVHALALFKDRLWAGTDRGIGSVPLDSPNLQDPGNWHAIFANGVRDFLVVRDTLFVATRTGVVTLSSVDGFPYRELAGVTAVDLATRAGQVHLVDADGRLWVRHGRRNWEPREDIRGRVRAAESLGDALWLATPQGLRVLGDEQPPPLHDPAANRFYQMTMTPAGDLWVASVPKDNVPPQGVYRFDGEDWTVYNTSNALPSNFANSVTADTEGNIWVGTWGRGLAVRDTAGAWSVLNETNSPLKGIDRNPNFVVITGVHQDPGGIVWAGNIHVGLIAMDGFPIQRAVLYDQQTIGLGINRDMGDFVIGPDGLKWISTPLDGFVLFDDGGNPFEVRDAHSQVFNTVTEPRLTSDRVAAILVDRNGRLWVGTDNGLNRITGSYSQPTRSFTTDEWRVFNTAGGLPSNAITSLAEDGHGHIWVGTENGLVQMDRRTGAVIHALNTDNSGLIDNHVNSLLYDTAARRLWIGTNNGLSLLHLDRARDGTGPVASVYPNPFVLRTGMTQLTITGLPLGAHVAIFTVNGERVRHLEGTPGQGSVVWDTLNDSGYRVSSGIYLYVATGEDGRTVRGQFAVIDGR